MNNKVSNITIIGGGTAGWLTAGILASRLRNRIVNKDLTITLCESPNIPTIGVGEGTWPTMPATLKKMGISETDFIRECDASFKQGSKFNGWGNDAGQGFYYHPFDTPVGMLEGLIPEYWLQQTNQKNSLAQLFSPQEALCEAYKAPKSITHAEYAGEGIYGYHLNAGAFSQFLQKHCVNHLGVQHILADVADVKLTPSGDIDTVILNEQGELGGDLFIDCTGFKSLLLGKALKVPFKPVTDVLFADTALAAQVNYPSDTSPISSCTQSTAQSSGWIWDIGLPTRRGTGHVFSSQHTSIEQAEIDLRQYIDNTGGSSEEISVRKIDFSAGYREKFWHKNCVAVGLSAGFLEPLEASALVLVELAANFIAEQLPPTTNTLYIAEKRFNEKFTYRWGRAIDFLKLHYILSNRETPFWQDNRKVDSIPERLQELMQLWQYQVPKVSDFESSGELFQAASFQFVLYGSEFKANILSKLTPAEIQFAAEQLNKNTVKTDRLLSSLPSNRALLNKIYQFGLSKV